MNRHEALKWKLDNRELVCGTTCTLLESTVLLTQMDHPAMDFMLFDGEHGRYNAENLLPLLHTCRMMDLPSIVRVSDACYHLVAKQLYMGADDIMLPNYLQVVADGFAAVPDAAVMEVGVNVIDETALLAMLGASGDEQTAIDIN